MEADKRGLMTMVSSLHHMKPNVAREILKNAKDDNPKDSSGVEYLGVKCYI